MYICSAKNHKNLRVPALFSCLSNEASETIYYQHKMLLYFPCESFNFGVYLHWQHGHARRLELDPKGNRPYPLFIEWCTHSLPGCVSIASSPASVTIMGPSDTAVVISSSSCISAQPELSVISKQKLKLQEQQKLVRLGQAFTELFARYRGRTANGSKSKPRK